MARKLRIEFPGALYHVIARGNNKQKIFLDEDDYYAYMNRLEKYYKRYGFFLYAFVLMPNHLHFLLETGITPLSKIMQGIQLSYTCYFNKKYNSVGHVFQGRYKTILCQKDIYLLRLLRYIHLNPVRAGMVKAPEEYPWSSYHSYLGGKNLIFVCKDFVLNLFSEEISEANKLLWQFIRDGIDEGSRQDYYEIIDQRFLGGEEFVKKVIRDYDKEEIDFDKKYKEKTFKKYSLERLLSVVAEASGISRECILGRTHERKVSQARQLFVFIAIRYAGFSNKELSGFINKDSSNISYIIKRVENNLQLNKSFVYILNNVLKVLKA